MKGITKKDKPPHEHILHCFKCGQDVKPHTLYCPRCNRRQPIIMEGLDRAYDDDMPQKVKALEAELEGDPKSFYRHFILGNALFLSGDYPGAVHRYKMTLDLKPDFGEAKLNLGFVLSLLGDKSAAISMLEEFRREQPHSNRVEGALKLEYELKGLPWNEKKPSTGPPPEIIKPGISRKEALIKREGINIPSLVFILLLLIFLIFGLARRDILQAAYDRMANTAGDFLSGNVSTGPVTEGEGSGDESAAEESGKLGGNDLMSRLFGRRQAEKELVEGEESGETTPEAPPVEPPKEDEEKIKPPDPNEPKNANPKSESYWPMAVGYTWAYDGLEMNGRGELVEGSEKTGTIEVTRKVEDDDTPVYEVHNLGQTSYFYETEGGIYQARDAKRIWTSSIPNITKPVEVGDKWTDTGLGMGYEAVEEIDIRVPAGLFKTIRIKTWLLDYPEQITEIFFGKGVGPVKLVSGSAKKGFRVWELSDYPDFGN